ncbi:MAG TPA: hypothetical protein VEB42_16485 [Chitinophagaceae bacterium]|nr:hypothetical protein [Chitinophagaceae bacterium]
MSGIDGILTSDERNELILEVASFTEGDYRVLKTVIPQQHVIRIEKNPVPAEYAFNIIRYCELSAWIENPALIITLLQRWDYKPLFAEAIKRIKNGEPPRFHIGQRVWDPFGLAVTLPFVNRETTRRSLEAFLYPLKSTTQPPGVRVLIVKGPAKSGKSFTYDYIRYTSSFLANLDFRPVYVDFKKVANVRFGPKELARAILNQINPKWTEQVNLPELDAQQPARWINQLCHTIADQIVFTSRKCVIVLDNFISEADRASSTAATDTDQIVPRETIEMISALADISTGKEYAESSADLVRLVLLGFNYPITNYFDRVKVDDIKPLTQTDLENYFNEFAKFYNKTIEPDALQFLVTETLKDDNPNDPARTEKLAQRALRLANDSIKPKTGQN